MSRVRSFKLLDALQSFYLIFILNLVLVPPSSFDFILRLFRRVRATVRWKALVSKIRILIYSSLTSITTWLPRLNILPLRTLTIVAIVADEVITFGTFLPP
jgi:hypothetical protein